MKEGGRRFSNTKEYSRRRAVESEDMRIKQNKRNVDNGNRTLN